MSSRSALRNRRKRSPKTVHATERRLSHQTLERRELLAGDLGPQLISVSANSGENFRLTQQNILRESPNQLTFRFDGSQQIDAATLSAISIERAGGDGSFNEGNEIRIDPGFLGFGDSSRIVIARFGETLPDDTYRISIAGFDDTNEGIVGLRNSDGQLLRVAGTTDPLRPQQQIQFRLELGPQVVAVVPQPISVVGGVKTQQRNEIHVYFNEDRLAFGPVSYDSALPGTPSAPVVNPAFYSLFLTGGTVENTDDVKHNPTKVEYDPARNLAILTFADDLSGFASLTGGSGTFRLRVGSSQDLPGEPSLIGPDLSGDVGGVFATAHNLMRTFNATPESVIISGQIEPTANYSVIWPGAETAALGSRQREQQLIGQPDSTTGISIYHYNFAEIYGRDPAGNLLENAITDVQRQRVREVLALYSQHLGVQFIETEDRGLQFVTGDLRALVVSAITGAGQALHEYRVDDTDSGRGVLILNAAENWFDGYGLSPDQANNPAYFTELLRGIGSLLGIGNTFEQVPGVASGSNPALYNASLFPLPGGALPSPFSIEPDFLSASDIIPGRALHRPEIRDVDMYRFDVAADGRISIETFAQRLDETSLLDTDIKLWKFNPGTGEYDLVARNDDYYSNDSFIGIDVSANADGTPARYFVGITASGNDSYNPLIENSGMGGRSQGAYQMRVTFQNRNVDTIKDVNGTPLDGNGDGNPGGDFNFWFRTAKPKVDALSGEARTLFVDKSGVNTSGNGDLLTPYRTIAYAFSQARPGDIVRILPSAGADGRIDTVGDNQAYEIGRGGPSNAILSDGETFNVPRGVTVMIDAGTIIKLRNAKISVGSSRVDDDRSLAALQVLGTPVLVNNVGSLVDGRVVFTSYHDESFGVDTNSVPTTPAPGQWAGIEFRNDFDYSEGRPVWETEGIFLDYVAHADIRFGGGSISSSEPIVTPLQMLESRPTILHNTIQFSSDAAISADPNSFAETNFHAPVFQRALLGRVVPPPVVGDPPVPAEFFTSDYERVGPDIRGNRLVNNSINGLFVRVRTPAVGQREPMTVSGRFDDFDITHVISEVLVLQGQPGGPLMLEDRPNVLNVTYNVTPPEVVGSLVAGQSIHYRVTFVTRDGIESLASEQTAPVTVSSNRNILLQNLPQATQEFAGRRLYRFNPDPAINDYEFVRQLDRNSTTALDTGLKRGGGLSEFAIAAISGERLLPRFDARLTIDPGLVIKMDTARIETGVGADFYAEGIDGKPVVFTSRLDDEYGAGGTFDTNNDGTAGVAAPGAWSGLVFRQGSSASLDHAVIRYAGGNSSVSGGFAAFNPIEILQADVRLANSILSDNAAGSIGDLDFRDGVGFNGPATIFVRGSQPTIVNNVIRDNLGAAISINPDSLDFQEVQDKGRGTGDVDRFEGRKDNQGALIAGNRLDGNGINGMLIRNESLTTESVWDDTDIVHVVERFVYAWNHHHRSGLRLKSDPGQSLVVKMQDGGAIVADRYLNDLENAIGGTIQVIGQPGFPVILTSIHDDTVGAGFTPSGLPQNDTDNAVINASPGDWYGIVLRGGANDRNVAMVLENEPAIPESAGINAIPGTAQLIGKLAANETSSDENLRLGFNVRGTLSLNSDIDVYRFFAFGQTEVYLDIDDTSFGLDTVVELIDINGNILALSNSSYAEALNRNLPLPLSPSLRPPINVTALPLLKTGQRVIEGPNTLDAGMRVVLPGNSATENQYFVRVRSSNLGPNDTFNPVDRLWNNAFVREGLSSGQYQLSIRLGEADEIAGSTIRLADIRYATHAIDVPASPFNSPLAAEFSERLLANGLNINPGTNNVSFAAGAVTDLGNLLASHQGTLRVSGVLGNNVTSPQLTAAEEDLDVYRIEVRDTTTTPRVTSTEPRFVSVSFDIDYADQLGGPNTRLSVYNAAGQLVAHGLNSNIADDQGRPRFGNDMTNLSAGSAGTLDASIGPVSLPEGVYFVVVSSAKMIPEPLAQLASSTAPSTGTRIIPNSSIRRIAEENFEDGFLFGTSTHVGGYTPSLGSPFVNFKSSGDVPTVTPLFDDTSIVPYTLEDVRMFVTVQGGITGGNRTALLSVDPFTGQLERAIGQFGPSVGDLGIRRDGELFAYSIVNAGGAQNPGATGNYLNISAGNAAVLSSPDDSINFRRSNQDFNNTEVDPGAVLLVNAMSYQHPGSFAHSPYSTSFPGLSGSGTLTVVGNRSNRGRGGEVPVELQNNLIFSMMETNGLVTNTGNPNTDANRGFPANVRYTPGFGPASDRFERGVLDIGQFVDSDPQKTGGTVTGLAQQLFSSQFYAVTSAGGVYRFTTFSVRQPIDPLTGLAQFPYSRVINSTFLGTVQRDPLHSPGSLTPPNFSSLTFGPQFTEDGRYRDVLFATTTDGWIYTLREGASGAIEPAGVLVHGRSAIPIMTGTGALAAGSVGSFRQITGVAFSTREENPWHQSGRRNGGDHGTFPSVDQTQGRVTGGASLYFGFDNGGIVNNDGGGGNQSPGGAHGSSVSTPFSLENYGADDAPTLYFSYFLDVENNNESVNSPNGGPIASQAVDALRVFAAGDDGQWQLLATNNTFRGAGVIDEFDYFNQTGIPVQPLHDNTNTWRQARIDLSPLAGNKNVQLRFDFSTAGGMQSQFRTSGFLTEIQATPGVEVIPGSTFTLSRSLNTTLSNAVASPQALTTFEFVRGVAINIPAGNAILEGQQISITGAGGTVDLIMTTVGTGDPNEVLFDRADTAAMVAGKIVAVLLALDSASTAVAVGSQLRDSEALAFSLTPERFGVLEIEMPANPLALDGQSLALTNAIGATSTIRLESIQDVDFSVGFQSINVTADNPGSADGVTIRFRDTLAIGDNLPFATFSNAQRRITVFYNSAAATVTNRDFNAIVNAIDALADFTATLTGGVGTTPFTPPAIQPAFPTDEVYILGTDTADSIADKLAVRINSLDQGFTATATDGQLTILGAGARVLGAGFTEIAFNQGGHASQLLPSGNVPIFYHWGMTAGEVREAIRNALVNGLGTRNADSGATVASIEHYPGFGTNRIRVFEQSLLSNFTTLGFSTFLPGDEFGAFASQDSFSINPRPGMNNNIEGVFIDDIIIGFAERGELVTNAPSGNSRFVIDPQYNRTTTAEYPNEILVGGYTLEIRQSVDFAVPNDFNSTRRPPNPRSTGGTVNQRDEQFGLGRAFDTNDRFDDAVTLIAPDASQINDGDTFVISNGTRQLTFEFDTDTNGSVTQGRVRVPFQKDLPDGRPFPAHDVATAIRDAINSTQSRNILGIVAAGIDGTETGPSTATRINLFGSSVAINPTSGQFLKVDLVAAETRYGRETARTLPTVDQTNRQATNDTIGSASDIGLANPAITAYRNGQTDTLIAVGKVGDAVYTDYTNSIFNESVFGFGGYRPVDDVDAVRIFLNAGDGIDAFAQVVGLNLGSVLTPLVQIFDADTLAFEAGNVDGVTGFFAPRSGFYVVAVSSAGGFGEYQLTIRPTNRPLQPNQTDALVARYFLEPGDANVFRPQGQLIIESNFISDFAQTGIRATYTGDEIPGAAAASTLERHPGGVALLRNPNTGRLVPGTVIVNNVVTATQGTGIVYSGVTPASGSSPAPVPFGRIVNNTVVGSGSGVGVQIANSTSPTVLNNVFSGFATGLSIDASSVSTIENGNAFQGTTVASTRLPLASQSFVVPSGVALFQDPDRRLYIPAAGSQIIDSSFGNLNDRATFFNTVKQPVGISASPIQAPLFDAYGSPRVDDPTVTTPGGVGSNVFIDRGGIDRSDQVQPTAVLVSPIDWISGQGVQVAGGDTDRDASFVRLPRDSGPVAFFEIQLLDPAGTGPDVTTITADTVILTENGVTLIPGVDYTFGYSDNSRLIRLTPLSGLWRPDAVYEITLNNKNRVGLTLPRGDAITDGDRYIVTDAQGRRSVLEFDSGYVMQVPQTLGIEVLGPNTFFNDGDIFTIQAFDGTFRTFEINMIGAVASGNIPINLASAGTVDQIRDTILNAVSSVAGPLNLAPQSLGSDSLQIGSVLGHTVTGDVAGLNFFGVARGVSSGQQFRFQTGTDNLLFEFTDGSGPVTPNAIAMNVARIDTIGEIAATIAVAIQTELGVSNAAQSIGDGRVSINGTATDLLTVANSALTLLGRPGVTGPLELVVPQSATAAALDTLTFDVQNGLVTVNFEFTTNPQLITANRRVVLSDTDSPTQIAAIIAAEIDAAFTGALNPTAAANVVRLGEQLAIIPDGTAQILARIDVGASSLQSRGVSGGAIPVPFIPTSQFAPALAAASFANALQASPLQVTFFSPGGGTLLLDNIVSIDFVDTAGNVSVAGQLRPAITDLAGNPIESNRDNAETRFTIIMPEVEFDFGDAPDSYGTTSAQNGARHSVGSDAMPRLGRVIDTEADGQPFPLSDDSLIPVVASSPNSAPLFTITPTPNAGVDIAISSDFSVVGPTSGDSILIQIGDRMATFELVQTGVPSLTGNIPVPLIGGVDTPETLAQKLADAIRAELAPVGRSVVVTVDPAAPVIRIESLDDEDGVAIGRIDIGIQSYFVFLDPNADVNSATPNDVLGFLNPLDPAGTTIAVTVTGAGLLDAWVDFDGDGVFDPTREQILKNKPVVDGVNLLNIVTPANAVPGTTWVRFRLSTTGNLRPTGSAVGGEVEDYRISIVPVAPFEPRDDVYDIDEDMTLVVTPSSPFSPLMDNDVNLSSPFLPPRVFIVDQPQNGTVTITDPLDGSFDYVPNPAFNGQDFFTYRLSSEGNAAASAPSAIIATVTINVAPVNDAPVFDSMSPIELLERDDQQTVTVNGVITDALPGRPEAIDEIASQTIAISINTAASTIPAGLFQSMPVIVPTTDVNGIVTGADLRFVQTPDAFGTALLVIDVVDDHPTDPQTTTVTITVNIRPVNDPPRLNPVVLGIADSQGPDNQYSVAAGPGAGTILYTSAEDQTLFIPLRRPTGVLGYNRIGLLDVFTVGPVNETLAVDGGNQVLELANVPGSTSAGGTLTPVLNGSVLIGFNYQPPLDFNETFGGLDSFVYTVIDNNPLGGESWDLGVGGLVDDRLTTTGLVQLRVNRVNDPPQFNMLTNTINVLEDSPQYRLPGFAFNIFAGPPATAFDENDPVTGQTVSFAISGLTPATNQMFASAPTVSPSGVLTFTPAPNAFGSVVLEVRATDDGPDNAIRGDVVSSPAQLLTINIRPVNDRPVLNTTTPIVFTLNEDAAILTPENTVRFEGTVIPLRGTGSVVGLLDVFSPGPPNESANLPGGNQTIQLATPIPASTAQGGTLTRLFDDPLNPTRLTGLRYTPRPNFNGIDSFIYGVRDNGETSDLEGNLTPDPRESFHTVSLNVLALNDPPQFSGPLSVTVDEDATTTAVVGETIIANFVTDIAAGPPGATDELDPITGQTVSFVLTPLAGNPSNLFAVPPTVSSNGTLTFRTVQDANGVAVFTIFAQDTGPHNPPLEFNRSTPPRTFTITVNPINDPPTFVPDPAFSQITVPEDFGPFTTLVPLATQISPGPPDEVAAGQTVRFEVTVPAAGQSLFQTQPNVTDNGFFRFTPRDNAVGETVVSIVAIDSEGARSEPALVTITITEVNDTPIAGNVSFNGDENTVLPIPAQTLLDAAFDPDLVTNPNEVLQLTAVATMSQSGAQIRVLPSGNIEYDPRGSATLQALRPGQTLADTFTYRIVDAAGAISNLATVTVSVAGINDPPTVVDDFVTLGLSGPTTIRPLDNDFDVDGTINPLTLEITQLPAFGSVEVRDGSLIYTPFANFRGTDSIRYRVADDLGAFSESATITIDTNVAPVATNDNAGTVRGRAVEINVAQNDFDPDGDLDLNSIEIVTPPASGEAIVLGGGIVRYLPGSDFVGIETFTYTIRDTRGRPSNVAQVRVQVIASELQNPSNFTDVDASGETSPIDALLILTRLALWNREGNSGSMPIEAAFGETPLRFYDVDGNRFVEPVDALSVINEIALQNRVELGEGEQVAADQPLAGPNVAVPPVTATNEKVVAATREDDFESVYGPVMAPAGIADLAADFALPDDDVINTLAIDTAKEEAEKRRSELLEAIDAAWTDASQF